VFKDAQWEGPGGVVDEAVPGSADYSKDVVELPGSSTGPSNANRTVEEPPSPDTSMLTGVIRETPQETGLCISRFNALLKMTIIGPDTLPEGTVDPTTATR